MSYPFCETSNRSNTTLDFYHLMLTATCSPNKEQASPIAQRDLRNRTSYDWLSGQLRHPVFRAPSFPSEATKARESKASMQPELIHEPSSQKDDPST